MSDRPEPTGPDATPTTPPPRRYDDEVSLRELYLILRRGTPLIVVVTVLAVVAGALFGALRPRTFAAESVVEYTPATIITGGESSSLQFEPTTGLSFPAYESITTGTTVVRAVLEAGDLSLPDGTDVGALRERLSVDRVTGPESSGQLSPLTVTHRATGGRPEAAAELAAAWTSASMTSVQSWSQNGDEDADENELAADLEAAEQAVDDAERADAEFRVRDDRPLLQARLDGILERAAATDAHIEEIARELAAAEARGDALEATSTYQRALANASVAGLRASLARAESDAAAYEDEARALRSRIVELDGEARSLENTLARAEASLAAMGGGNELRVSPPRIRLISEAVPPSRSTGTSPIVIAIIAGVVAALTATLFVFLREAVRDPEAA